MSRLYYKHMMGEDTIGYYYNGEVYKGNPDGLLGDTHIVLSYNGNNIYKNGELIAFLDDYGNIREWRGWGGAGEALACIQDGKVYLSNGNGWESTLATYDGDIYGAAAAVVAFMLNLGGSQAGGTKTDGSNQGSSSSTTQPGGLGFGVIIELIVGMLYLIWVFFPFVPLVLFAFMDLALLIMFGPFVVAGFILKRCTAKKPKVISTLFAEGMMNCTWLILPILFGPAPIWVLGFFVAVIRIIAPVVKVAISKK